jgi:hypothetical protein
MAFSTFALVMSVTTRAVTARGSLSPGIEVSCVAASVSAAPSASSVWRWTTDRP